jgi:hypothetical protein
MRTFSIFLLILTAFLSGCATLGVRDDTLGLQITPQPLKRGQPALAKVDAPMDSAKVVGVVETFGSPTLIFAKDEEKRIWFFYGTIPFSPWVKPGSYKVRVSVFPPVGDPHYTEMKVELQ